jgi:hypothetical protein
MQSLSFFVKIELWNTGGWRRTNLQNPVLSSRQSKELDFVMQNIALSNKDVCMTEKLIFTEGSWS